MKNTLTPAGIEPATFRFVAQHLNHWTTAITCWDRQIFYVLKPVLTETRSRGLTLWRLLHVDVRHMANVTWGRYSLSWCSCTDWVRRSMVVPVRRTGWQAWVHGLGPGLPVPEQTRIRNRTSRRVLPVIRTRVLDIWGCHIGAYGDPILQGYDAV